MNLKIQILVKNSVSFEKMSIKETLQHISNCDLYIQMIQDGRIFLWH